MTGRLRMQRRGSDRVRIKVLAPAGVVLCLVAAQ
jgi:hypothetical protein